MRSWNQDMGCYSFHSKDWRQRDFSSHRQAWLLAGLLVNEAGERTMAKEGSSWVSNGAWLFLVLWFIPWFVSLPLGHIHDFLTRTTLGHEISWLCAFLLGFQSPQKHFCLHILPDDCFYRGYKWGPHFHYFSYVTPLNIFKLSFYYLLMWYT